MKEEDEKGGITKGCRGNSNSPTLVAHAFRSWDNIEDRGLVGPQLLSTPATATMATIVHATHQEGLKGEPPTRPSQALPHRTGKNKMIIVSSHQVSGDLLPSNSKRTDHQDCLHLFLQSSTVAHLCPLQAVCKMKCLLHLSNQCARGGKESSLFLTSTSRWFFHLNSQVWKFYHQTLLSTIPSPQPITYSLLGHPASFPEVYIPVRLSNTTPVISSGYLKTHVHIPSIPYPY